MFAGFEQQRVAVGDIEINCVAGGEGTPLLLLHGFPQTHLTWRHVAPRLTDRYRVVATDLRGYGDSSKPAGLPDHSNYSKRAMALDQVEVMRALGHERFLVCGHDRGGRVAHRLAVDHPDRVLKLALLDISPTKAMYEQTDMEFARAYYHWFFLIQPAPFPETLIEGAPEAFLRFHLGGRFAGLTPFEGAWDEYVRCFSNRAAIHASCEDYRAAASIDLEHDAANADSPIACPLLVLWGGHGVVERCFRPLDDWRAVALDVRGHSLPCGHYIPEEAGDLLCDELTAFFG